MTSTAFAGRTIEEMERIIAAPVPRAALRALVSRRTRSELAYCAASLPLSVAGFVLAVALLAPGLALSVTVAGTIAGLALLVTVLRLGRRLGSGHRRLAARWLTERWPGDLATAPRPFVPGHGILGRADARLRDGAGWRAIAYVLLKLPLALLGCYLMAALWIGGLFYLTYPVWWGISRGLADGTSPVTTPFPAGGARIVTWPAAFALPLLGAAVLLAAPWVVRLVVTADRWLARNLLGAAPLAERVRELEESRAHAVDDSAATLRRVERDLHDGAQVRLVALALNLGMAREKLGSDGAAVNVPRARELVDSAHRSAKEALTELRDLARGIHPPVLDNGLPDALATLTAGSAVPAELSASIPGRPTAAIEAIAYFCAAELLANVAKHSAAGHVTVQAAARDGALWLTVSDDGIGGADPGHGTGLAGLRQRVRTVDGRIEISSPAGGPTVVTVELPLSA
jgi:signal transduction histidine kinase